MTLIAAMLLMWCATTNAQTIDRSKFGEVDKYVSDLGPLEGHFLKYIVDTLTHRGTASELNKARAIYMWEANNIGYNTSARRHPKQANHSASTALNERMATAEGYANLFKAMCDLARLECVVIPGLAKFDARDIGSLTPKWNRHTWNAVKVNGTWYLVDVAWGAGRTDRKYRFYTKSFTDAWFFPNRELFALNHYPDKKNWQLLDTPINKSNFTFAPIVGRSALINEVYTTQKRGNVKGKADTTKNMTFTLGNPERVKSVAITRRTSEKIPVKYAINGNQMAVDIPFKSEGDYAFNLYVNDELAYIYQADVGKARKKPAPRPQPGAKKAVAKKPAPAKKGSVAARKNGDSTVVAEKRPMTKKEKAMEAKREAAERKKAEAKEKAANAKKVKNADAEPKQAEVAMPEAAPKEPKPMTKKEKMKAEKKALEEKNAAAKKEREAMLKEKNKSK